MCLSGDVTGLGERNSIVDMAIANYRKAAGAICDGMSKRYGSVIRSHNTPNGWQAVVRAGRKTDETLIVVHTFDIDVPAEIELALPEDKYESIWSFKPDYLKYMISKRTIKFYGLTSNTGFVVMLKRSD